MPTDSKARTLEFHSLDGLLLRGTLVDPPRAAGIPTVLVHGGGVTRDEGGFFTRFADALARAGSPALRFDFRAHGQSEGNPQELTLAGVANDIHAAVTFMCHLSGTSQANLVGASFGGGISALFTARHPDLVHRLTLFNPLLDYKKRFIDHLPRRVRRHHQPRARQRRRPLPHRLLPRPHPPDQRAHRRRRDLPHPQTWIGTWNARYRDQLADVSAAITAINTETGFEALGVDTPEGGWYLPLRISPALIPAAASALDAFAVLLHYGDGTRGSGIATLPGELFGYRDGFLLRGTLAAGQTPTRQFTERLRQAAAVLTGPDRSHIAERAIKRARSVADYVARRLAIDWLPYPQRAAFGILTIGERMAAAQAWLETEDTRLPRTVSPTVDSWRWEQATSVAS